MLSLRLPTGLLILGVAQILHADFEFVEPYFDGVSSQAKDLIRKMLVVDPEKRLSAPVRLFSVCQCKVLQIGWILH